MLNRLLRFTLMNPRTILTALAASLALNLALASGLYVVDQRADAATVKAASLQGQVDAQTTAAQAIADAADLRARTAERAAAAAREAGKADRLAAERYLNLPLPAPADRCEAAQALVDEAIEENRL